MNYYLGVDIGTTSVKAVAFSENGEITGREQVSYSMRHPESDRSELDPDEMVLAVCASVNKIVAGISSGKPLLMSFSAAMHSLLAIAEDGSPLTACMIWADNRAAAIAGDLRAGSRGMSLYRTTGVPVHAMTPLCKLAWLRQHEPEIFRSAWRFIGIKEYVFLRLFGENAVDTPIASATGLLNIRSREWDEDILNFFSVGVERLSKLVPPGHTIYYDPGAGRPILSLPSGTPIVIGSSDGACANLATGASGDHIMSVTIGTSCAARMVVRGVEMDNDMRTFCYHVQDGCYLVGGASNNGAVVMQWLKEKALRTDEDYEQLFSLAGGVAAGSEKLLFIPYLLGERSPIWNSSARGIYFGLDISHEKAHLVRAAMEGVINCVYSIGKILVEKKEIRELHASGGFVRSPLWLQILADVFNKKVLVFGDDESSALGAVITGMQALGIGRGAKVTEAGGGGGGNPFPRKALAVYSPDADNHAVYMRGFKKFGRVYELVKSEFSD